MNEENKIKKVNDVKENTKRTYLLIFLSIILVASIICLILSYATTKTSSSELLYSYNINRNIDYRVNLYQNSFIEKDYLNKDETYISDLVKNIDSDLSYNFILSKKLNLKYTYDVKATIIGEYQSTANEKSTEVWKKDYTLVEEKTLYSKNSTNFTINEKANIDFPFYNNAVSEFRKNLKLPISAYLSLTMHVKVYYIDENGNENLLDNSNVDMNIPLNKQAFNIKTNYKNSDSKNIFGDKPLIRNNSLLYTSFILFVFDMIIFTVNFKKISTKPHIKSKYKSDLNKILKTYGDVIVEIVNPIKTKLSGIIDVKDFNEMIDLEEELRTPILFYEIPGINEGWFTIIHQEILYRYVLKDNSSSNNFNAGTKRRKI